MTTVIPQRTLSANIYPGSVEVGEGIERTLIELNYPTLSPQLEMDFMCTMSITPDANRAVLRIFNLSKATRDRLAGIVKRNLDVTAAIASDIGFYTSLGAASVVKQTTVNRGDAFVEVYGGYKPSPALLFQGSTQWCRHMRNGPTWLTEMEIGDGLSTMMDGVASKQFPPGALLIDVIKFVVQTMGLGLGNLSEDRILEIVGPGKATFPFGFTCFGESKNLLSNLIHPYGGEWFVDRGECYFVMRGQALPDAPIIVSPDSGLLASPDPVENGKLRLRSVLRPDVRIGRKVAVQSSSYEGTYRVEVVTHAINNRVGQSITDMLLSPGVDPF